MITSEPKISIAELQKITDNWQAKTVERLKKMQGDEKDITPSLAAELLEANGYQSERRCFSFHLGNNKINVYPHFFWDGACIVAHLGEDPNQGAWGVAATVDDAARDLLQELRERMTPDGYLLLRGSFAKAA